MKLQLLYNQLVAYLPLQTDFFSTFLSTTLSYSGGTVIAGTATTHDLTTGDHVMVKDALEELAITSITSADGIATAITVTNNDLTQGFQTTVNISGADQAEYNGDKTILNVIDETTFTFSVTGTPVTPATGTIYLNQEKAFGYNGYFEVTALDTTTFTYTVDRALGVEGGSPQTSILPRVYTVNSIDRLIEIYTEQAPTEYVLFINLGANISNRDRDTKTDANYEYVRGQEYRQANIQTINLFVVAPTGTTVNAGEVRDTFEDLRFDLIKSLAGAFLDSGSSDTSRRAITYVSDDLAVDNRAYLIHQYIFEVVYDITNDDIFKPLDSVVIQNINIKYLNPFDVTVKEDEKEF